jgi:hypothetical protein
LRDKPDAAELLETARATEGKPNPSRYELLMVAAARDIVAREQAAGEAAEKAEHAALQAIYGDGTLLELNRRFARDIRAGRFDGDATARDILRAATDAKLSECNPRYPRGAYVFPGMLATLPSPPAARLKERRAAVLAGGVCSLRPSTTILPSIST